jgi:hypothetical protein
MRPLQVLDTKAHPAEFWYADRLSGEPVNGIAGRDGRRTFLISSDYRGARIFVIFRRCCAAPKVAGPVAAALFMQKGADFVQDAPIGPPLTYMQGSSVMRIF